MTAVSDVPDAVRPWLDALRVWWPDMRLMSHRETFWRFGIDCEVVTVFWSIANADAEAGIYIDLDAACRSVERWYTSPAPLVARLRELLPVPVQPVAPDHARPGDRLGVRRGCPAPARGPGTPSREETSEVLTGSPRGQRKDARERRAGARGNDLV